MELSIQDIFGSNATQSATQLIIDKNQLLGLVPSANNTADQLFVALIQKVRLVLSEAAREANPDISITISDPSESIAVDGENRVEIISLTIEFYRILPDPISINPMNY